MAQTVREVTYDLLRELGLTFIFGNPGSSELPFITKLPPDFRYILGLHERAAAGAALGYALGTGKAAFANLHSVASVGNGLSAIIDAHYMHAPLIVTTGQQDRRQVLAEPFLASRAVEVVRPYVKWAYEPLRAEDVPAAIARAYFTAIQPPCGPVFVSIPIDDWNRGCEPLAPRAVSTSVSPDTRALDDVVRALGSARKLALVAGSEIEEDGAWTETIALAEHLLADVYADPIASRWTFPRSHRLFRGGLLPAQGPLADQLAGYDTVLVLGAQIFLYYACVPGPAIRPGTKLFHITNSPEHAAAALAGTSVVGNIAEAARYLRFHAAPLERELTERPPKPPQPKAEHPISSPFVFSVLNGVMPRDAVIVDECPSSKGDIDRLLLLDQPGSFYSGRSGILGFALPFAVGMQLARPGRRVVCPIGDGSAQYSIQALWTAVQYNLPILFVALRNGDYSVLKSFGEFTGMGRAVPGCDLPGLDLVKLAQGYGMSAREIDRPEDLEPALREAFAAKVPRLICVNIRTTETKTMGMDQSVNPPNYA